MDASLMVFVAVAVLSSVRVIRRPNIFLLKLVTCSSEAVISHCLLSVCVVASNLHRLELGIDLSDATVELPLVWYLTYAYDFVNEGGSSALALSPKLVSHAVSFAV